jgi:hypothetical protein
LGISLSINSRNSSAETPSSEETSAMALGASDFVGSEASYADSCAARSAGRLGGVGAGGREYDLTTPT